MCLLQLHTFLMKGSIPFYVTRCIISYYQKFQKLKAKKDGDSKPHILITGDMNGRIGDKIPFGDPVRNNRLLDFSDDADLTIINCTKMCFCKIQCWSESGLGLYPCGLGLGLHLCGLGLKHCGLGLWSYGFGLGLHPGGLGLTVSPGESGEKCTRQI